MGIAHHPTIMVSIPVSVKLPDLFAIIWQHAPKRPFVKKVLDLGQLAVGRFYFLIALKSCTRILENSCQRKISSKCYSEQYWAIYNSLGTNLNSFGHWLIGGQSLFFIVLASSRMAVGCTFQKIIYKNHHLSRILLLTYMGGGCAYCWTLCSRMDIHTLWSWVICLSDSSGSVLAVIIL